MKKLFTFFLSLSIIICTFSACSNKSHTEKKPTTEYEKVLFALKSVEKAMIDSKLERNNSLKRKIINDQIIASDTVLLYNKVSSIDVFRQSKIQSVPDAVNDAIMAKCFQNIRTLDDAFDVNIVKYVISFLKIIENDWDKNVVYSTSVSGTLKYNFETFTTGNQDYPYVMDILMKAEIDEDETVKIKIGFDVSLTSTEYSFSRYADLKVSSAYNVDSNDFSLQLSDCSDYTNTPSSNGFISYEKMYITVTDNVVQYYTDYSAQTDRRISLDNTHQNWQDYYNEGTKFTNHAKIFDGENVYQSYTNFLNNKATSIVYKDALMTLFVDNVGLHEEINDTNFFDSVTTESNALKTAEEEMSKSFNNDYVYTLLENLEEINLQVENTETPPFSQGSGDEKTIRQIMIVDESDNFFSGSVFVDKDVTIEELLIGNAECKISGITNTIKIKITYTDNSVEYAESLDAFEIFVEGTVVSNYNSPIVPENSSFVLVELKNSANNTSATLYVSCD